MGKKATKKTKKFVSKKLPEQLKKRQFVKKIKEKAAKRDRRRTVSQAQADDDQQFDREAKSQTAPQQVTTEDDVDDEGVYDNAPVLSNFIKSLLEDEDMEGFHRDVVFRKSGKRNKGGNDDEMDEDDDDEVIEEDDGEDASDASIHSDDPFRDEVASFSDEGVHTDTKDAQLSAPSASSHKDELDALQKTDPEFYEFLQKEDAQVLQFGEGEDENDAEDGGDDDVEMETQTARLLTEDDVEKWLKQANEIGGSLRSTKKLVLAFRTACHLYDEDDVVASRPYAFAIDDADVFESIMAGCCSQMATIFDRILFKAKEEQEEDNEMVDDRSSNAYSALPVLPPTRATWHSLKPLVKSYLGNLLHFARSNAADNVIEALIAHIEHMAVYFSGFAGMARNALRFLLENWSGVGGRGINVRFAAFTAIRRMAIVLPRPFVELAMKGCYLTYARNAKFVNAQSLSVITFMGNGVTELFGIDFRSSYRLAFVYIRQLAIHLRTALTLKTKEAHENVYNWRFVNCLKVWAQVLAAYPDEDQHLNSLVYPLVQVISGVIRLLPSTRNFGLRFQCVRALLTLSECRKNEFVPVLPFVLPVLDAKELLSVPTSVGKRQQQRTVHDRIQWDVELRVPRGMLGQLSFVHAVMDQFVEIVYRALYVHARSIAFAEICAPILAALRRFRRATKIVALSKKAVELIRVLDEQAQYVMKQRQNVPFAPKDRSEVAQFLRHEKSTPFERHFERFMKGVERDLSHVAVVRGGGKGAAKRKRERAHPQQQQDEDEEQQQQQEEGMEVEEEEQQQQHDDDDDGGAERVKKRARVENTTTTTTTTTTTHTHMLHSAPHTLDVVQTLDLGDFGVVVKEKAPKGKKKDKKDKKRRRKSE